MGQLLLFVIPAILIGAMALVIGADRDDPERNLSASCLLWGVIGAGAILLVLIAIWIIGGGGIEGVDRAPQSALQRVTEYRRTLMEPELGSATDHLGSC